MEAQDPGVNREHQRMLGSERSYRPEDWFIGVLPSLAGERDGPKKGGDMICTVLKTAKYLPYTAWPGRGCSAASYPVRSICKK
jgi:hypothetical protein